ncbi:XopAG/AvrGf1 family type III secretion system effector [Ralstonia syzygii]|uniref:XopAG/AvrGf1 family type III secretion system effector n=1 Tax=Ralstonia syzygii TaxID=28097 RepID=UPI001BACF0CF|nr:XopAG/AvrGf1 family type III secretion system effector [Ralstonia syzygii]
MKLKNYQFNAIAQLSRLTGDIPAHTQRAAVNTTTNARQRATEQLPKAPRRSSEGKQNDLPRIASRIMKYALFAAGSGYAYDKIANDFFLSTTSLHDGKGGFTSNDRLDKANEAAKEYFQRYHSSSPEEQKLNNRSINPIRTCGSNRFVTMTDYRAATKTHVMHMVNTEQAHQSLVQSLTCLKGHLVKAEHVAKYNPSHVPKDPDLTKSSMYEKKNKYALTGIPNEETGARGYTSRSITQPFPLKGYQHFKDASETRGLSLKQCVESLEALLQKDSKLSEEAQFAAGQAILNFRQVYAMDEHWGHAEKVILKTLADHGVVSPDETYKIDESLMFEDPSKNILKRNTGVMGPRLHKLETRFQEFRLRNDPAALEDLKPMSASKNMENLAIAHFKLNEQGNGFEDSSGLGDSFTCVNAVACINHARLMSGKGRLSKDDVVVLIGCLNAVYDDVSGIRHTLQEVARGCFAGAGYSVADADRFYEEVCKKAAEEFYGGKNLGTQPAFRNPTQSACARWLGQQTHQSVSGQSVARFGLTAF